MMEYLHSNYLSLRYEYGEQSRLTYAYKDESQRIEYIHVDVFPTTHPRHESQDHASQLNSLHRVVCFLQSLLNVVAHLAWATFCCDGKNMHTRALLHGRLARVVDRVVPNQKYLLYQQSMYLHLEYLIQIQ